MTWLYTPYVLPVLAAAILSAGLAAAAWRRRQAAGMLAFVSMMAAVALWGAGYALELVGADLYTKIVWAKVEYIGIVSVPVAWLVFASRYTSRDRWLNQLTLGALFVVPSLTLLLVFTNDLHGLIWPTTRLDPSGPFLNLQVGHGPIFWVQAVYAYVLLLAGTLFVILALIRSPRLYRGQASLLLLGSLTPWIGNALYLSGASLFDLTPLAFTVTGLVLALALFRFQLLDLVPVAREVVVEGMPDPMLVLDLAGRVVDLNPAAERLIGQGAEAVVGRPGREVLQRWPQLVERFRGATDTRAELVLGEGEAQRQFELQISPLTDRRGRVTGRLAVARDITERKRAEAALRAFSADLEQRVEERTRELQQSQEALLASQKLASVGTLAAGVVHEVSNPLNTIITAAESLESQLAAETVDPEALKLYLPIISRAAWHAARIVQALRTYSRGSAPELASQNLSEVVQDALLLMGYQLKQWRNIKLEMDIDPDMPDVLCDRNQIAQVLINLLGNARDAMPEGGTINLRTRLGAPGAVIEVADEGTGILPEGLTKIFDPFYTTKPIGEGSGLGLSIVAGIIRAHNGTIAARSDGPGKGAAFTITLPVVPAR